MIGIDLGTTNSLVALFRDGEPRILANEMGETLTPSAVAVSQDGQILVGRAAKDRLVVAPDSGKSQFKRDMGTDTIYRFGGKKWTPTECSALVLREMKRIAEMALGHPIDKAVITVPAYFHDLQRNATLDAAKIAGLAVERIVNEPTAAALAYGYANPQTESSLVVFDLGGGTFDVTLLEVFDGVIEVRASGGVSHLGGEDYTDAFASWIKQKHSWQPAKGDEQRWRQHVEVVKRRLSHQDKATVSLGDTEAEVTYQDFTLATAELTARIMPVVRRCLSDAGATFDKIDDILLVGGATRSRNVVDQLARESQRLPNRKLDPDAVIALGASIQAALCQKDAAVQDLVLTDVCPHTLGIEISKELLPGKQQDGYFSPIIDRNTTVPVSRSDTFNTLHPQQDTIRLRVYQGESRTVAGNRLIGEIKIDGLRHRPEQKQPGCIDVRFSYDMNGVLEVEVTTLHNARKTTKVFQDRPGSLTEAQIQESIRRFAPIKIHPREQLPNLARLERSNRLYRELIGVQRDELSHRVQRFEAALESQDEKDIKLAAHSLDRFLEPFFTMDGEFDHPRP